jgi:hypothetical protein
VLIGLGRRRRARAEHRALARRRIAASHRRQPRSAPVSSAERWIRLTLPRMAVSRLLQSCDAAAAADRPSSPYEPPRLLPPSRPRRSPARHYRPSHLHGVLTTDHTLTVHQASHVGGSPVAST